MSLNESPVWTFLNMAAEHMCISEERLALLMKEIFQEEFKKQERNILNTISGHFEISMNEIKNLKQEISELKSSLDFTEDVLEKKVEKLEENMKDVDMRIQDIYEYQVDPNYVLDKLAELEDRSRRNTATAIDHIFTNTIMGNIEIKTAIVKTDILDHFPIIFATKNKIDTESTEQYIFKRNISDQSIRKFKQYQLEQY